jgi:hypothetical protein
LGGKLQASSARMPLVEQLLIVVGTGLFIDRVSLHGCFRGELGVVSLL